MSRCSPLQGLLSFISVILFQCFISVFGLSVLLEPASSFSLSQQHSLSRSVSPFPRGLQRSETSLPAPEPRAQPAARSCRTCSALGGRSSTPARPPALTSLLRRPDLGRYVLHTHCWPRLFAVCLSHALDPIPSITMTMSFCFPVRTLLDKNGATFPRSRELRVWSLQAKERLETPQKHLGGKRSALQPAVPERMRSPLLPFADPAAGGPC